MRSTTFLLTLAVVALHLPAWSADEFPCGIEQVRVTNDGVALKFEKSFFWKFTDSQNRSGVASSKEVVQLFDPRDGEIGELVSQPYLEIKRGEWVRLYESHSSCVVDFDPDDVS